MLANKINRVFFQLQRFLITQLFVLTPQLCIRNHLTTWHCCCLTKFIRWRYLKCFDWRLKRGSSKSQAFPQFIWLSNVWFSWRNTFKITDWRLPFFINFQLHASLLTKSINMSLLLSIFNWSVPTRSGIIILLIYLKLIRSLDYILWGFVLHSWRWFFGTLAVFRLRWIRSKLFFLFRIQSRVFSLSIKFNWFEFLLNTGNYWPEQFICIRIES